MHVRYSFIDYDRKKPVPYPEDISSDSIGYGFFDLKSDPSMARRIPEAKNLPNLVKLLEFFSEKDGPFFSIGCEKAIYREDDGGYSGRGYIEFAFNYPRLANRQNYRSLFDRFAARPQNATVNGLSSLEWQVSPIEVTALGGKIIQSCTIWAKVANLPTEKAALKAYNKSMLYLEKSFRDVEYPVSSERPIF